MCARCCWGEPSSGTFGDITHAAMPSQSAILMSSQHYLDLYMADVAALRGLCGVQVKWDGMVIFSKVKRLC